MRSQHKLLVLSLVGLALEAVGLLFLAIGLTGLAFPIACAFNGCPPPTSSFYAIDWYEIQAGYATVILGMTALGIGLVLDRRRVEVSPGEKHSTAAALPNSSTSA